MRTENQNVKTGVEPFDNVISSLQLLHEYIQENDNEDSFAILIGGALNDENMMHLVNSTVGSLRKPEIFEAAVTSLVKTMRESDMFTKLIFSAYHNFQTDRNVKVVKLSAKSPLEALMLLKNIINGGVDVSDLDDIPSEIMDMIVDNFPPELESQFLNSEPCDDPNCLICLLKRKLRQRMGIISFPSIFGINPNDKKGN